MKLNNQQLQTSTTVMKLTATAALTAALSATANAATVGLFDFGSTRGTASAQNFINVGVSTAEATDTVTLVDNGTLAGSVANTAFLLGSGISMTVDSKANSFTYGNSVWTSDTDVNLMGDAWLFNGLGDAGTRSMTLSGLATALSANQQYRIYLMGSYGANEYTKFGSVTYDGSSLGTQDGGQPSVTSDVVTNPGDMAVSFDFTTSGTIADTLTFTIGKATGSTGNAAGIQGIAIVAVPEPSSTILLGLGSVALLLRRRNRQ